MTGWGIDAPRVGEALERRARRFRPPQELQDADPIRQFAQGREAGPGEQPGESESGAESERRREGRSTRDPPARLDERVDDGPALTREPRQGRAENRLKRNR
jgi:hypothetical protein